MIFFFWNVYENYRIINCFFWKHRWKSPASIFLSYCFICFILAFQIYNYSHQCSQTVLLILRELEKYFSFEISVYHYMIRWKAHFIGALDFYTSKLFCLCPLYISHFRFTKIWQPRAVFGHRSYSHEPWFYSMSIHHSILPHRVSYQWERWTGKAKLVDYQSKLILGRHYLFLVVRCWWLLNLRRLWHLRSVYDVILLFKLGFQEL